MLAVRPAYRRVKPGMRNAAFIGRSPTSGVGSTPGRYIGTPHATNSHSRDPGGRAPGRAAGREWRRRTATRSGVHLLQLLGGQPGGVLAAAGRLLPLRGSSAARVAGLGRAGRAARLMTTSLRASAARRCSGPASASSHEKPIPAPATAAAGRCPRPPPRRSRARPACAGARNSSPGSRRGGRPARWRSAAPRPTGAR